MPAHIYARVGDHAASAHCNELAAAADKRFLAETHQQGVYPMMYYSHNLHFLAYAACMRGDFAEAKSAAAKLVANVAPGVKAMPPLEGFLPTPMIVLFAFEHWDDILKLPAPDPSLRITNAVWHSLRGIAFANTGNAIEAQKEQQAFHEMAAKIPPDTMYDQLNKAAAVFKVHEHLLSAAIAHCQHAEKSAIDSLHNAITAEDALSYSEPPAWYPPLRSMLGRLLLANKQPADAEKVFRADLDRNPRDARALSGLRDALRAQDRQYEADQIDRQFRAAWKVASADTRPSSTR
jgi:Flp pilus assembly protein TadD